MAGKLSPQRRKQLIENKRQPPAWVRFRIEHF